MGSLKRKIRKQSKKYNAFSKYIEQVRDEQLKGSYVNPSMLNYDLVAQVEHDLGQQEDANRKKRNKNKAKRKVSKK